MMAALSELPVLALGVLSLVFWVISAWVWWATGGDGE